ncbi:MAG TPA: hypothetical protein VKU41_26310, partial [Polyangiaceae bacterium]|nr:hypothetical protein [Polyangiaceae bacterium]
FVPVTVFRTTDMLTAPGVPFNAWLTAGPVFFAAGGGARYAVSNRVAILGLLKFQAAFGGSAGLLPGFAPEIGVQFGL